MLIRCEQLELRQIFSYLGSRVALVGDVSTRTVTASKEQCNDLLLPERPVYRESKDSLGDGSYNCAGLG